MTKEKRRRNETLCVFGVRLSSTGDRTRGVVASVCQLWLWRTHPIKNYRRGDPVPYVRRVPCRKTLCSTFPASRCAAAERNQKMKVAGGTFVSKKTVDITEEKYLEILKNSTPEELRGMQDRAIAWGEERGMEEACKAICPACFEGISSPIFFAGEEGRPIGWIHRYQTLCESTPKGEWSQYVCVGAAIRERYARKTSK